MNATNLIIFLALSFFFFYSIYGIIRGVIYLGGTRARPIRKYTGLDAYLMSFFILMASFLFLIKLIKPIIQQNNLTNIIILSAIFVFSIPLVNWINYLGERQYERLDKNFQDRQVFFSKIMEYLILAGFFIYALYTFYLTR